MFSIAADQGHVFFSDLLHFVAFNLLTDSKRPHELLADLSEDVLKAPILAQSRSAVAVKRTRARFPLR